MSSCEKKLIIIYLISGLIVITGIGTIVYLAWLKDKLVENKKQGLNENKEEGRFFFAGKGIDWKNNENYIFDKYENGNNRMINVNKNHPRIKQLLNQGQLKDKKEKNIIRFNKEEEEDYGTRSRFFFFFNEFNKN